LAKGYKSVYVIGKKASIKEVIIGRSKLSEEDI